jgi:hypothetical protein
MTSFFALLALGSHECACPHIGEKERELFPRKLGSKDERGDERKTPRRECVCCGKALNLLGMRTALALDCEDR